MNDPAKAGLLLPLVERLQQCPTQDSRITTKLLVDSWGSFKTITPEHGDTITPAVLLGLILYDQETFAPLLNAAEHAQLQALGKVAQEHYLQLTNPPNKLGKTLAATLKEQT